MTLGYGVISFRMSNLEETKYCFQRANKRAPLHNGLARNFVKLCVFIRDLEKAYEVAMNLLPLRGR